METNTAPAGVKHLSPLLSWKAGIETPPFVSSNTAVCNLLNDLVQGAIETVAAIVVSAKRLRSNLSLRVVPTAQRASVRQLRPGAPACQGPAGPQNLCHAIVHTVFLLWAFN